MKNRFPKSLMILMAAVLVVAVASTVPAVFATEAPELLLTAPTAPATITTEPEVIIDEPAETTAPTETTEPTTVPETTEPEQTEPNEDSKSNDATTPSKETVAETEPKPTTPAPAPTTPAPTTPAPTEPKPTEPKPTEPEKEDVPETRPQPTEPVHVHNYVVYQCFAPSCTHDGYTVFVCDCGENYSGDVTPAIEHDYVTYVIEPTYDEQGYDLHICQGCGANYQDNYIPAIERKDEDAEVAGDDGFVHGEFHCDPSDGHDHEEVKQGDYVYIYCEHVRTPHKSLDGLRVWSHYDLFF